MFKPRQNPGAASLNRNLLSFVIWAGCASSMLMVSANALGQPAGEAASSARTSARAYPEFGEKAVTRPSRDATMGFSNPTQVKEIAVKGGQKVKLGQLLIRGDDTPECPHCQSRKLNKLLSVVAGHVAGGNGGAAAQAGGCGLPQCGRGGCGGRSS
jgi:hypothetical protein